MRPTGGSTELRLLIVLARRGESPSVRPHHGFVYHHVVVFLCTACSSGQIETWDHDCMVMAPDEPWDAYDWYVLDADDALRLRTLLGACPAPRSPACECALHEALRVACRQLPKSTWSGFAWVGRGDSTEVRQVALEVENGRPRFVPKEKA